MSSALKEVTNDSWQTICSADDIAPDSGVCALFDGEQVAIFKIRLNNQLYAISNYDPIGQANVLSRGIVGSIDGQLVVASPLYKQHYNLETGQCLEEDVSVTSFKVRVENGKVQISR